MPEVRHTVDFDRVANLPRRRLTLRAAEAWASVLTDELRAPGSTATLQPWQGFSLAEVAANDGGFLGLPVGFGKTLISYLLAVLLNAETTALILPANLREKTYADFGSYRGKWRAPRNPHVILSFHELAPESGAARLEQVRPTLVIIDEGDEAANPDSTWARRIDRYVLKYPGTVVVVMSGTPGRNSIMNYWHLVMWCLRERAPLPLEQSEAREWALCIDEGRNRAQAFRSKPGPLGATIEQARAWYRRRLAETPGVVLIDGDSCKAPLTIRTRIAREDPVLNEVFERFLTEGETPGGEPVTDPLSFWRLDGQLGCGLNLYYDPPPPAEWRIAQRTAAAFVRNQIQRSTHTSRPLDSEAQVFRRFADHPIVTEWKRIKPTFEPVTKAAWHTDSTIQSVRDWLAESTSPGVVWTGCVEFGKAVATAARLPYYGAGGRDQHGRQLHAADARRSFVCSWNANKKGFNLQAWRRALVVMPPQSAKWLEQLFGRHHRQGQNDPVVIDILLTSGGTEDAFFKALAEAGFNKATLGMTQKILRATVVRGRPTVTRRNRYRWATKEERSE